MAPIPNYPGVYVDEIPSGVRTIRGVPTSICAFVGRTRRGPLATEGDEPPSVYSLQAFEQKFGAPDACHPLGYAVRDFFANGGTHAVIARLRHGEPAMAPDADDAVSDDCGPTLGDADYLGDEAIGTGLHALCRLDAFNLLCIPPDAMDGDTSPAVYRAALALCVARRAMLLVDPPAAWDGVDAIVRDGATAVAALGLQGDAARNAALYFPRIVQSDATAANGRAVRAPCGVVAGVIARTDATRGVWKAPAGTEASVVGVNALSVGLGDDENGLLNPIAVNCLRTFPAGHVVWGARTMRGADGMGDEYKYVPVRRLALFIEESVSRGIAWAASEPNDEALWARLRLAISAFMHGLFVQGAFQGTTPRDAYFVKCDAGTTTAVDIANGICNLVVGFAPLKPAEFVVLRFAQATATG